MKRSVVEICLKYIIFNYFNSRCMLAVLATDFAQTMASITADHRAISFRHNSRLLLQRQGQPSPASQHDNTHRVKRDTFLISSCPATITSLELLKAVEDRIQSTRPVSKQNVLADRAQIYMTQAVSKRNALAYARNIWRGVSFPYKTSLIIQNPVWNSEGHATDVYIGPKATVLSTLIDAARKYLRLHGNVYNPYNVLLPWDDKRECYIMDEVIGIENSPSLKWRITVENRRQQVIYDGRCLPFNLILQPDSVVVISYTPTNEL